MIHDKKINNLILNWLTITMGLIFLMIIVGGFTRLTDSGLSITEWELFSGIIPPINNTVWEKYFELYKTIPQFKLINPTMNLEEFKVIFYWEYAHRILGRVIGLFFLIPLIYFHFFKKIKFKYLREYYFVMFLIILQGIAGWYMVTSGLVNDVTVSHYRLSLHLSLAILIISILFWKIKNLQENTTKVFFDLSKNKLPFIFLIFLIFTQIIFGAFVSGLDAGKIYQTWPLMGESYFPNDYDGKLLSDLINFENHSLIQFYHRNIAYLISIYIFILSFLIIKNKKMKSLKPLIILIIVISLQIILGIFTLISQLNMFIAASHQILSVILILSSINLYYSSIK